MSDWSEDKDEELGKTLPGYDKDKLNSREI